MGSRDHVDLTKQSCPEKLPSLLEHISCKAFIGFDNVETGRSRKQHADKALRQEPKDIRIRSPAYMRSRSSLQSTVQAIESHRSHVSISMPSTPSGLHIDQALMVELNNTAGPSDTCIQQNNPTHSAINPKQPKKIMFYSQPITAEDGKVANPLESKQHAQMNDNPKDKCYDSFKTWSGKLERQISNLRGKPQVQDTVTGALEITESEAVPAVGRYFDALEGPELDTLRASEESVLPKDKKWPFLLRFPLSSFSMCLGVSSQAILWKTLAISPSTSFLHVSLNVNLILWCISIALMSIVSVIYSLKIVFYFEAVRREFYHPIRVNFFFAPWIACLFLAQAVPPSVTQNLHAALWYVLMAPIFCLELKIYGQWMSGGRRRLSKVANPSNHLSIVGNFVGALLGASMGLKEGPIFFFAIGLAHYLVLFVTLYQRLPTNETLPKELHPVFFLFVAAPSVACIAWAKIQGEFGFGSRIAFFISMFLYASLAVRINFFRGFRFSIAWWAYTFPMTGASVAAIHYSNEVTNMFTVSLSVGLSLISAFAVAALLVSTIFHAFVLHDLFPNDISIAITYKRPMSEKKLKNLKSTSSHMKDIEVSIPTDLP